MQRAKKKAANAATSTKSGMEKTKAIVEEKVDVTRNLKIVWLISYKLECLIDALSAPPFFNSQAQEVERMRTKDIDKKTAAELNKKEAKDQNANARHGGAQGYTTTGEPEYSTAAYDPTNDTIEGGGGCGGGGGPVLFDHPTVKTQDPSFPC